MTRTARTVAAGLAAFVAACSNDPTGAGLTPLQHAVINADVAAVATDVTAEKVEVMRGPGGAFGFGLRADPGKFECTGASRDGLTITRSCTFKDAAGNTQPAYDPVTTASASVTSTVKGAIDRGPFSATIDRSAAFTATGLAGNETRITWNGTSSGKSTRVRQVEGQVARQYDMTHTGTWTDVVVPVPRGDNGWPISGTARHVVTVRITGGPNDGQQVTREVRITFNGTSAPTATVNGEAFELDLASRGRPKRRGPGGPAGG